MINLKLFVDKDSCIGCQNCHYLDEKLFEMTDEGLATVSENVVYDSLNEEEKKIVEKAIEQCPTEAIILEEKTEA